MTRYRTVPAVPAACAACETSANVTNIATMVLIAVSPIRHIHSVITFVDFIAVNRVIERHRGVAERESAGSRRADWKTARHHQSTTPKLQVRARTALHRAGSAM